MKSLGSAKLNLRDLLDHMERAGRQVDRRKGTWSSRRNQAGGMTLETFKSKRLK